jgi:hypothetical protein
MKHIGAFKAQRNISFVVVFSCSILMLPGCGRGREPSGKYVSVIRLSDSGEEWTETIEFKRNGICYYGHPPTVAECKMVPAWKHDHDLTQRSRFKRAAVRRQTAC